MEPFRPALHAIANQAHVMLGKVPAEIRATYTQRTVASSIHDFFFDGAAKFCSGRDDARIHTSKLMRTMILGGKYIIRFKLIGEDNLPRNQLTKQVADFRRQGVIDGLDNLVNLEIGYQIKMEERMGFENRARIISIYDCSVIPNHQRTYTTKSTREERCQNP